MQLFCLTQCLCMSWGTTLRYEIFSSRYYWHFTCSDMQSCCRPYFALPSLKVMPRDIFSEDNLRCVLWSCIHRCGPGGSVRACHAAGPGSIPGRNKFPEWGFFGGFPHLQDKCREALGPKVPEYHLAIIIIIAHHSLRARMTWDVNAP